MAGVIGDAAGYVRTRRRGNALPERSHQGAWHVPPDRDAGADAELRSPQRSRARLSVGAQADHGTALDRRLSGSAACAKRMARAIPSRPCGATITTAKGGVVRCHDSWSPMPATPSARASSGALPAGQQIGDAHAVPGDGRRREIDGADAVDRRPAVGDAAARAVVGDRPGCRQRGSAPGRQQGDAGERGGERAAHRGSVDSPSAARQTARTISSGGLSFVT